MTAIQRALVPQVNVAPVAPDAARAQHVATVRASGAPATAGQVDCHERVSVAHARLAELHAAIATIHQELAQDHLAAGAGSALMERVPEASKTRRFLTVTDVAELLQIDAKTIRNWRGQGKLPRAITISGVVRWDAADIDRWLAENREAGR